MNSTYFKTRPLVDPSAYANHSFDAIESRMNWLKDLHSNGPGDVVVDISGQAITFNANKIAKNAMELIASVMEDQQSMTGNDILAIGDRGLVEGGKRTFFRNVTPSYKPLAQDWPRKDIMAGVVIVLGDTDAGKTFHIRNELEPTVIIRNSEPYEDIDNEAGVHISDSLLDALELSLVLTAADITVALDSLRTLVYELDGPAMAGGLSATLFGVMTTVNNMFAAIGGTAVVAINPMLSKPEDAKRLYERLGATAAGAIFMENRVLAADTFRLTTGRVTNGGGASFFNPEDADTNPRYAAGEVRIDEYAVNERARRAYPQDTAPEYQEDASTLPFFNL